MGCHCRILVQYEHSSSVVYRYCTSTGTVLYSSIVLLAWVAVGDETPGWAFGAHPECIEQVLLPCLLFSFFSFLFFPFSFPFQTNFLTFLFFSLSPVNALRCKSSFSLCRSFLPSCLPCSPPHPPYLVHSQFTPPALIAVRASSSSLFSLSRRNLSSLFSSSSLIFPIPLAQKVCCLPKLLRAK